MKKIATLLAVFVAIAVCLPTASAARKPKAPAPAPLTKAGEKLAADYSNQLSALQAEIKNALPKIKPQQKEAFLKAYQAEATATATELAAMQAGSRSKDKEAAAKNHSQAKETLAAAKKNAEKPSKAMLKKLRKFLRSNKLDDKLVKYFVISDATPQGLAAFAQQGNEQKSLIDQLLNDTRLMKQMAIAGGANGGQYGQAMKIYTDICKADKAAKRGVLQRLAMGISLEHATPIALRNPKAQTNAPATVDPVKRYMHYKKAFLAGELDAGFKDLTVWDYRNVVNGNEPDWTLTWGREMLKNYRPDHITLNDYRWRYVKAVKTDVRYGSQDNKYDQDDLQFFQNILKNGGVCGRRAFFGRFILRAFGIPTLARPQRGHATLVHWTPDGWVICLGAGWGWGWTSYGKDVDFVAYTQARAVEKAFPQVLRAQWAGMAEGETKVFGFCDSPSGFWNGIALYTQRAIIEQAKAKTLAAVGTDIGEANESKVKDAVKAAAITSADKKISVCKKGVITIPAAACSKPANSTAKIIFMKSNLGGMQLHYGRLGNANENFEYTFNAPKAGKYALTARVVTPSWKQHLFVAVNGSSEKTDIALPYTVGMWDKTKPVEITLKSGKNVLTFSREHEGLKGVTIRDFTLTPVK